MTTILVLLAWWTGVEMLVVLWSGVELAGTAVIGLAASLT